MSPVAEEKEGVNIHIIGCMTINYNAWRRGLHSEFAGRNAPKAQTGSGRFAPQP